MGSGPVRVESRDCVVVEVLVLGPRLGRIGEEKMNWKPVVSGKEGVKESNQREIGGAKKRRCWRKEVSRPFVWV